MNPRIIYILLLLVALCNTSCSSFCSSKTELTSSHLSALKSQVHRYKGQVDSLMLLSADFSAEDNTYGVMLVHDELGQHYRKAGDFPKAIAHHQEQVKLALDLGDTIQMVRALNNIGTNYRRMGVLDEASTHHFRALSLTEQFSDKSTKQALKNRVISLNGIGNVYLTLDNRHAADSVFRLALKGEHDLGSALGQAINYANIGALFESDGLIDSARYYYEQSLKYNIEAKSAVGISLCHGYFGRLYEREKNWTAALSEYRKAYETKAGKIDDWHWMESCIAMARIYMEMGGHENLHQARRYMSKALATASKLQSWEHLSEAHSLLYRWYLLQANHAQALNHYVESRQFADSVANAEQKNRVQNLRFQYQQSRKQREIDLLQANYEKERQSKTMYVYIFLIIILFAALLVGFLVYAIRVRERQRQIMQSVEKMRRNFYTNITHEFRTPLTVILGFSRMLEEKRLAEGESLEHIGAMISRQGNHLLTLINQLLDISKIRSEVGASEWYRGDVVPYVEMICDSHQVLASLRDIDLQCVVEKESVMMDFAPEYLEKLMTNLLSNSLKFTNNGGQIYVSLSSEGEFLKIVVSDTGQGIDKQRLPHIFDPFYQCDQSHSSVGTGIGLSLVKQIIDSMHGRIHVESAVGVGTVFTIHLPLSQNFEVKSLPERLTQFATSSPTMEVKEAPLNFTQTLDGERPTVLIVEDHADVSHYIASELKDHYQVNFAKNGREGFDKAVELVPDMILTDLMMPDMDGYALCQAVRANELINHIPIIVITAKSSEEDRIKGIQHGADAFLCKPFNAEELHVQIVTLLESRKLLREKYSEAMSVEKEDEVEICDSDRQFLNRVVNVVWSMIDQANLSNEEIAFQMCISSRQLNRKIYAITGRSTLSFVMQIRLERAKRLMMESPELSIGDIAVKCGFTDSAYFSRVFKKIFKLTPSQYRKQN